MGVSNPPTVDSTKSLVLPIKLIGHIKAAIYTGEGRQVLDILLPKYQVYFYFRFYFCFNITYLKESVLFDNFDLQ